MLKTLMQIVLSFCGATVVIDMMRPDPSWWKVVAAGIVVGSFVDIWTRS